MKSKVLVAMIIVFLFAACQPTPTEEFVNNRLDGSMKSTILTPAVEPYQYEAPTSWQEELAIRDQTIYIDAAIEVPTATMHPVYTIRNRVIAKDSCMKLLEQIFGTNLRIREQEISYEELLTDLMMAERGWYAGEDEETGEILWEPYDGQQDDIARIKQQLSETPFEESYVSFQSRYSELPITNRRIMTENGDKWYLFCGESDILLNKTRNQVLQTEAIVLEGDAFPGEEAHALVDIRITEEDAIATGETFLQTIGRPDMHVAEAEKARLIDDYSNKELGEGYLIRAVTTSEGCLPVCYGAHTGCALLDFSNDTDWEKVYAAPWIQERILLFVTENGIVQIEWTCPKSNVLAANENVQLLPFDEIQNRIRKLLEYGLRPGARESVHVERIVLCTAIQQIPNQGEEAFLIPAWAVFARSDSEIQNNKNAGCFLVNALDGSYVGKLG